MVCMGVCDEKFVTEKIHMARDKRMFADFVSIFEICQNNRNIFKKDHFGINSSKINEEIGIYLKAH